MRALIIVCVLLFSSTLRADINTIREIEALGLDAWSALKQANVTYEKGAKRFYLSKHLEYLACVGIGSDDEN